MQEPEIMTIDEVAKMLRVSERTVYEWAQKGIIPGGKLGTSWRFKRSQIQKWVDEKIGAEPKRPVPQAIRIADILTPDRAIIMDCERKEDALNVLIDRLAEAPEIGSREELAKEIFHREQLMSTGIGFGVGIPHVRLASVKNVVMAMGVSRSEIRDYASLDGKPVRIVCMIAAGRDQHARYIKALAAVSALLKDESFRNRLLAAKDAREIYSLMTGGGN